MPGLIAVAGGSATSAAMGRDLPVSFQGGRAKTVLLLDGLQTRDDSWAQPICPVGQLLEGITRASCFTAAVLRRRRKQRHRRYLPDSTYAWGIQSEPGV